MAVKTNAKSKVKPKAKAVVKKLTNAKVAPKKVAAKPEAKEKPVKGEEVKAPAKSAEHTAPAVKLVKRTVAPQLVERRHSLKKHPARGAQFNFMKPPGAEYAFEVGDIVEVFCDHEKNRDRIRGWVKGIIVQVDHKLAAVQFRSDVYLTDGWMVPDRILWFPTNSENIRPLASKKAAAEKKDFIPDY